MNHQEGIKENHKETIMILVLIMSINNLYGIRMLNKVHAPLKTVYGWVKNMTEKVIKFLDLQP